MNYYKEVKSAFDDWATTYESDVVPTPNSKIDFLSIDLS